MTKPNFFLVRASATSVLGEYDHALELNGNDEFVILYGPNGVGKTRFLEIIDSISSLNASALLLLPFKSASLDYSDGSRLVAEKDDQEGDAKHGLRSGPTLTLSLFRPCDATVSWTYGDDEFASWVRVALPYRRIRADFWEDPADGEVVHIDELRERYERQAPNSNPLPDELKIFTEKVPTYLIETQRLRIEQHAERFSGIYRGVSGSRALRRSQSRIREQAEKLQQLVNEAQTEHSRITQRLDRSFPKRVLVSEASTLALDADSIRSRYNEQNEFRSRLGRVASLALEGELALPERTLEDWELKLLDLYLRDAQEKLAPFEGLLQKIELLEQIVNSRLLNKQLRVTDGEGLTVEHAFDARDIELDFLSSGEQHEIILMIDLLFNVPTGAIVLIDEPEISLHVVWQLAFIPDVRRIAALAGFRFVVATHSPQIINDEWERAIRLGPPEVAFS